MIEDLDNTLKSLLKRELPELDQDGEFSFDPPHEDPSHSAGQGVDLFLYDVRENRDLRSAEWTIERSGVQAKLHRPPVRVDCSYLITAWAGDTISAHTLLGQVMQALLRYPTLPETVLQGKLQSQELPPPTSVLQPGNLQSLGEFWQALGGKPRAALNYTVTISVDPFDEPVGVPLVTETGVGLQPQTTEDRS